jgi:hypothetical protein
MKSKHHQAEARQDLQTAREAFAKRRCSHQKPSLAGRVRAHVFLSMLAYYVEWHMRQALPPILFNDEDQEEASSRRYGAMTFCDHARCRLSIIAREEAQAIVAYLQCKRDSAPHQVHLEEINAALESFWLDRAENAPTAEELAQHLAEEREYLAAIRVGDGMGSRGYWGSSSMKLKQLFWGMGHE